MFDSAARARISGCVLRKAAGHIEAGAEKVIISAPGKGNLSLASSEKRRGFAVGRGG